MEENKKYHRKNNRKHKYYTKKKVATTEQTDNQFNELEALVANETLNELEYYAVLEYVAKKCLTDKGREIIFNSLPVNRLEADLFSSNANVSGEDESRLYAGEFNLIDSRKFWLNKELTQVAEMLVLQTTDDILPLENIADVREILNKTKIDGVVLDANEILTVVDVVRVSQNLRHYFDKKEDKYPTLFAESLSLYESQFLLRRINDTMDESGEIRDNATPALYKIRQELIEKSSRLRSRMNKIVRQFSDEEFTREDFYTVRDGRFVLPIKAEHKRHIGGIIHGVSQTGSTVYLEPSEVIEMNNEISLLKGEEQREIYNILKKLTRDIARDSYQIADSYDIMGHLDAINAKAEYALKFGGCKPEIIDTNELYLDKIYHPILVQNKGKANVVPLSIDFNLHKRGHLISGPNAGGKTVALKSIGLNVLLALSGFFPLGEVKTPMLNVFSAIGDNQSIENDLSTFSSQLLMMKQILDVADANSLILIDEICSGTDPREGSALAAGILDTFVELRLFFVVTTHQSSLKTYALNTKNTEKSDDNAYTIIENDSFEFDETALKPTYTFLAGMPGNSYAFVLARNVGLSSRVVSRAKKYLGGKTKQLEKSISILQRHKKETETLANEARTEKLKYEGMKKDYENRKQDFVDKKKKLLDDAKIEANEIVQKANALVENTIKELREEKRNAAEIKAEFNRKQKALAAEASTIKQNNNTNAVSIATADELDVDDNVGMVNATGTGTVLESDNINKTALVAFNGMKFRLPYSELYLKDKPAAKKSSIAQHITLSVNTKLDLRGYRADEAINATSAFIAQAIMGNADYVTIVHGKGTGALRHSVHELLRDMPGVKSFRLGELYEGGSGATIAYLK